MFCSTRKTIQNDIQKHNTVQWDRNSFADENDHNSTQKAPKSIIPQKIKSAGHFPSSDSIKSKFKAIFKKMTFLDSQVLFFMDFCPRRET